MSEWKAIEWSCHAASTVVVDDPTMITGKRVIAECDTSQNAKLIAAAPEMLDALRAVFAVIDSTEIPGSPGSALEKVRAAIAKATQSN